MLECRRKLSRKYKTIQNLYTRSIRITTYAYHTASTREQYISTIFTEYEMFRSINTLHLLSSQSPHSNVNLHPYKQASSSRHNKPKYIRSQAHTDGLPLTEYPNRANTIFRNKTPAILPFLLVDQIYVYIYLQLYMFDECGVEYNHNNSYQTHRK